MDGYEKPVVVDYGSLEELTAACETPGSGDAAFPDTLHSKQIGQPGDTIFCFSN
jgi:hypothetical protein